MSRCAYVMDEYRGYVTVTDTYPSDMIYWCSVPFIHYHPKLSFDYMSRRWASNNASTAGTYAKDMTEWYGRCGFYSDLVPFGFYQLPQLITILAREDIDRIVDQWHLYGGPPDPGYVTAWDKISQREKECKELRRAKRERILARAKELKA